MKILILHPEDDLNAPILPAKNCDLVVDLAKAPVAAYRALSDHLQCPAVSLQDFNQNEDLQINKALVHIGAGCMLDDFGIDWWNMFAPVTVPHLQQLILVRRLANSIHQECEIYSSRSDYRCVALRRLLGGRLTIRRRPFRSGVRRLRHYSKFVSNFGFKEMVQIAQDKFDSGHAVRSKLSRNGETSSEPLILLPTAYINVSRTAIAYAQMLPEDRFLLVCTRDNAKLQNLPANVQMISLDRYFDSPDKKEIAALLHRWDGTRNHLTGNAEEYESGAAAGLFDKFPALLRWGITIRDAWVRLFESWNISSCFCADHNNPYTRVPLLLAKHSEIPAIACHHGALDLGMAITTHDADFYLAKSGMEHDYMARVCGIDPSKIVDVRISDPVSSPQVSTSQIKPWMVFFSEPYELSSLRVEQVYDELLPHLCSLAEKCEMKLVFKLHPFESAKGHRKILLRHLPVEEVRKIGILTGPISDELWANTRFALTGQSSVALECQARGIPIFLCDWLQDSFSEYVEQYRKFGVGYLLESAAEIADVPRMLKLKMPKLASAEPNGTARIDAETLKALLTTGPSPLSPAV